MSERERLTARDVVSNPTRFPNDEAELRLSRLVGVDDHIESLVRDLRLIFDPVLAEDWSATHYGKKLPVLDVLLDSVPLIVFAGDVGTGKTALAETIGQRLATEAGYSVHSVKMSTRVRGTGYVGEMGTLLAESFEYVGKIWKQLGEPLLFIIDEADSLLTSRESRQQHHEDKSGVNTILQHLDALRRGPEQVAVVAITNRIGVLDPAILRRATAIYTFDRPDDKQRAALFVHLFDGAGFGDPDIDRLVGASKPRASGNASEIRFSYSDLVLRFVIPALRTAIHDAKALDIDTIVDRLHKLTPTPAMESVDV